MKTTELDLRFNNELSHQDIVLEKQSLPSNKNDEPFISNE
jgi:hypothetical protein